ncbi:MAG: flagellin FliC [Halomonas sp.]|nr:MAG: flagellin FliC [Halomonas sp.]
MSVINTNITSMIGQSNLSKSQNALQTSMERLSSGLRINSAKDDAAGQAIANRMTAQITGLSQAQRNANDGISVAQTAEGALNQINDNLQRVRELTTQAQNGTNSQDDLTSIQNEIDQRLNEINRISEQTDFNGVKVLASDQGLKIQVGANDGESINVGLKEITAKTLGMDGFNVDGSGVVENRAATVTDLNAAGATGTTNTVTTTHDAATFDQVLDTMVDGNKVSLSGGGTVYTYSAESDNFSYNNVVDASAGTNAADLVSDKDMVPATGTKQGSYTNSAGATANFDVSATGDISIGGQTAYWTAAGELTTNNDGGSLQAATMENMVEVTGGVATAGVSAAADSSARSFTIDNTTYTGGTNAGELSYEETASVDAVKTAVGADATGATATLGQGITSATVTFGASSTNSTDTYIDADKELTAVASFTTDYNVNADTGEVTVASGTGTGKYEADVGARVYVSASGNLTTSETSKGERTEDPLATLDAALNQVDSLRSDLGAIQNRFESAITNLQTNETNLSAARSRIEDADYATEVANMTRAQILQQAGTSVLAQANQIPQNVLSLLG